ncbi:MerR family transcriptional regulator [Burkholderia stabilis]|uniref:Copper export regulator,zinc-responsive transcriptional regulator,Transcriptional regulator, effector-binding domain/component,Cu(I)-responsive transcriptional regulator,MerR family regulatory protein n=1 Tax=Burkholderia stabilis TaxID=95485 RepID=A0AAJ5NIN6_9BURK|nr:MerR family transcriptional regulator [Burkholderia stabilis]AOR72554.1 MerR family transcriptional regulator [Burkholderia stabilis]VBB16718.1 Copper export regulator,zinc-responsive transcriptional regulator,Transcriptional regulator, effector-binding domain/component,Cu(I)-responsive transcriptional regulator,MerR family regulatory protein [Burkholderia stabilis]HDR9489525.1 MerR family transcriptional regulator [Burkholderia stabilis]HDR9536342.1 MerR family transcriptional regulator [Bu
MRIGELAKLSGLTASRIRFYEAEGLITAVERSTNGYRDYADDAVWMLEIIAGAQRAGFSLEQIRHLLPVKAGNWQHDGLVEALERKVAEIEAMQQRLKENKAQLLVAIDSIRNRPTDLNCSERTRWVMDRLRDQGVVAIRGKGRRSTAK